MDRCIDIDIWTNTHVKGLGRHVLCVSTGRPPIIPCLINKQQDRRIRGMHGDSGKGVRGAAAFNPFNQSNDLYLKKLVLLSHMHMHTFAVFNANLMFQSILENVRRSSMSAALEGRGEEAGCC